ncbi:MAG TPA: hypothetical protein VG274_03030 [Rhizomicrobium sp.]|jgi:hypothetical protein|nr:hypothetical protein [Rhizomicrobium sp.]
MRGETFDFISNFSTLWQVVLGACLATAGGLAANQFEWRAQQQRRERNAALFFGEVLSSLAVILKLAHQTKQIGDPFGPITLRMLRSARREIDIYERNRESLIDLRDANLRARIHRLTLRIAMPLDGMFDGSQEIALTEGQLRSRTLDDADRSELEARVAGLKERRDAGYEYMCETSQEIAKILSDLAPLARHSFSYEDFALRSS